ncbi:MAG: hypothetical protein RL226_2304 [Bacteroidota bacterium]
MIRRWLLSSGLMIASIALCAQTDYQLRLQAERDSVDQVFRNEETSILREEDRAAFEGLNYFPIDENWKVEAAFQKIKRGKAFKMKTTTDRLPVYKPYGTATFVINGQSFTLTIYQNLDLMKREGFEDYLFIPFTDETNYEETYAGGRYMDLRIGEIRDGKVVIDFNTCYNPYCAYNHKYSCPIPPSENHLKIRVLAGVMAAPFGEKH